MGQNHLSFGNPIANPSLAIHNKKIYLIANIYPSFDIEIYLIVIHKHTSDLCMKHFSVGKLYILY